MVNTLQSAVVHDLADGLIFFYRTCGPKAISFQSLPGFAPTRDWASLSICTVVRFTAGSVTSCGTGFEEIWTIPRQDRMIVMIVKMTIMKTMEMMNIMNHNEDFEDGEGEERFPTRRKRRRGTRTRKKEEESEEENDDDDNDDHHHHHDGETEWSPSYGH